MMISSFVFSLLLILSWNLLAMTTIKLTCEQLKLPRECQCQFNRLTSIHSFNETRLRCRQLTDIHHDYQWSSISYDRLIIETSNDNLTFHRSVFADLIVRSLQIHAPIIFFRTHTFDQASIGQLAISNARIEFTNHTEIFSDTKITNLYFKSIDFQHPISEWIFSTADIHILLIESSKFYGYTNTNRLLGLTLKSNDDDDDDHSINDTEQTVRMNITSSNSLTRISIYTIISSINTTILTENYFPNNLDYKHMKEMELIFNHIDLLDRYVFRNLVDFSGRLILHHNQIRSIHLESFDHLFHLKNLSLAKNTLSHLSSRHFQDLEQLIDLNLSFNQFTQFDNTTFEHLSHLERLSLSYNPIEYLHPETFIHLKQLREIHFQGIPFMQWITRENIHWLWNLANLHRSSSLIKTDFELSDVAFCILSRYNRTLFVLSRPYSCSCSIHYFNRNLSHLQFYPSNYLRITPVCQANESDSRLNIRMLDNQCDYRLNFLDCDAMTTTTIATEYLSTNAMNIRLTTSNIKSASPSKSLIKILTNDRSLNNIRKLFTVLAILIGVTISAIFLVFMWYRCQTMLKRRRKKRSFVEQSKHFNSPAFHNHSSMTIRYASSDMSGSLYSAHLSCGKSQSEALIESSTFNTYKNLAILENDLEENLPVESLTVYD